MTTPPSGLPERETGASRLLDSIIRERLFGTWREVSAEDFRLCSVPPDCTHVCETATGYRIAERYAARPDLRFAAPEYSSDIAAAMEIIPKLHEMGLDVVIGMLAGDPVSVDIWQQHTSRRKGRSEADTLPLAICRAALAALDAALLSQGAVEALASQGTVPTDPQ